MHVRIEAASEPPGVVVIDDIEHRRVRFETPSPVVLGDAATEQFRYPVETAATVETTLLELTRRDEVNVHDEASGSVTRAVTGETTSFPAGSYTLDVAAPVKVFLRVAGPFELAAHTDCVSIAFEEASEVVVGARSYHERPATTITTTERPVDVMAAIGAFSSALKTTSCERSYPTLRGHPPLVELGDELDLNGLTLPGTGVSIEVPPELDSIYAVASLAFYLGAAVRPGNRPRIVAPDFEYGLTEQGPLEDTVAAVLRQVLFLDCVVRTEGLYQIDLYEREQIEPNLPFEPAALYDRPLDEQLRAYLKVSYQDVRPLLPRWVLTAHVPPRVSSVSMLPHVVNELGIVRTPRGRNVTRTIDGRERSFVEPEVVGESVNHAWFADGQPLGTTKAVPAAYRHKLAQGPPSESIEITIVCNDESLAAETGALDSVYGFREDQPYEISSVTDASTDELRTVLVDGTDFLHFIGEVSPNGIVCSDGALDARSLADVGVTSFLLSAPRSFEQSMALVEKGAVGGVATLGGLSNDEIRTIGRGLAHLLNLGFPLAAAVELVRKHAKFGERYLVIGDGTLDIAQPVGTPMVCDVRKRPDGDYDLTHETFPTRDFRIGTYAVLYLGPETAYLIPGRLGESETLSGDTLREYLRSHSFPIRVEGQLRWNNTLDTINL